MKKIEKIVTCLLLILLLAASIIPVSADPPPEDRFVVHSWAELKRLYDASQKSNAKFLAEVAALDAECDCQHLSFHYTRMFDQEGYNAAFIKYYEQIVNRKVLVPKNTEDIQVKEILADSYGIGISSYSLYYQIKGQPYQFWTPDESDYSASFNQYQKEPDAVIKGDGYSVHIWYECSEYGAQCYKGYCVLDGEETPSFYMKLENSNNKKDVPEELISLFGEFRITTAAEIMAEMDQEQVQLTSQTWIRVASATVLVAALVTVVILRKKKQKKAKQTV